MRSTEATDEWLRWLTAAAEVAGFALTVYFLWEMAPERWKLDIRRTFSLLRAPLAARAHHRRAVNEMWLDVIELQTWGVPTTWHAV